MSEVDAATLDELRHMLKDIYVKRCQDVPFHGWHHLEFVEAKVREFAPMIGADLLVCSLAALVHDVNHLVVPGSRVATGLDLMHSLLRQVGIDEQLATRVERVVSQAETASRGRDLDVEAQVLSDADSVYKVLPITPVLLVPRYLSETGMDIAALADRILTEQLPLEEEGIYFYIPEVKRRYGAWATSNLTLWSNIVTSLRDPDILRLEASLRPTLDPATTKIPDDDA